MLYCCPLKKVVKVMSSIPRDFLNSSLGSAPSRFLSLLAELALTFSDNVMQCRSGGSEFLIQIINRDIKQSI